MESIKCKIVEKGNKIMEKLLKDKIELVRNIGYEICIDCVTAYDYCGIEPKDCSRIINAVEMLDRFIKNS